MNSSAAIVRDLVRTRDRERYLATLYAPEDRRAPLLALYAFDAELAGIRTRVREPLPGEMRLQWWRDILSSPDEHPGAGNPVAESLIEAIDSFDLPRQALQDYLDARIFDLYDDPMPSRTDLEGYLGETVAAPVLLGAMILDRAAASAVAELAGHAGCALGIARLLRALPIHRMRGQCYIPGDILAAVGCSVADFIGGSGSAMRAVEAMVALGREHLDAFERGAPELPASLRPAFLPVALVRTYLARAMEPGASPLERGVEIADWRRQAIYLLRATRGWPRARAR